MTTAESSIRTLPAVAPIGPGSPHWNETLHDGTPVLIRPIGKSDVGLERAFIERLSPETRRFRFLGQMRSVSNEQLARFCDIAYDRDVAFVALVSDAGELREIGVSRYCLGPDATAGECALVVADEWQHRGLGTALMKHLIEHARSRGVRTLYSIDLAENVRMEDLARYLGFERRVDPEDPRQVVHTIRL